MKELFPQDIINTSVEKHFSVFNRNTKLLYLFVLLIITGAIASLFFIKTEITLQSKGILRSSTEPVALYSPVVAQIVQCSVFENKAVKTGDTLLWLNTKKLESSIEHYSNLIEENELYRNDISKILACDYTGIKSKFFSAQQAEYQQKLEELQLSVHTHKKNHERSQMLFDKQVIPLVEMEEQEFKYLRAIEQKQNYVRNARNEWERKAVVYRTAIKQYRKEITLLENEKQNYFIIAPETGHITNYKGATSGSYVGTGENLAYISPNDDILSEHLVSPRDIGYIQKEMPVLLQVDAYNYNQWGLASGKILEISNEIYMVNNQPYFKVWCSLNEKELSLKNGYTGKLKKGLTATARFRLTKRTLAQLLVDKTDKWFNPKIMDE